MAHVRMNPALSAFTVHLLAKLTTCAKFSFIIGSKMAFFAPAAILLPLAGAFGGVAGSLGMLGMGLLVRSLFFGFMPMLFLAYHLPGFFASLYWATNSKLLRVLPVLVCAFLFLVHPIGTQCAWYSLFWLVPVFAAFNSGLLSAALGSSFTAHAVGTVVWLYTGILSVSDFAVLAPVVIVERLMIAVAMALAYKCIVFVHSRIADSHALCALVQK